MKKLLILLLPTIYNLSIAQQNLETVFEKSQGQETATYQQTIIYYQQLAHASEFIQIKAMGETDSGEPLHLVIIDKRGEFDFSKAHANDRPVILFNNGIHPGEPDGIEASKMLARDLVVNNDLLGDMIVGIIPVYNIGGALNRNSYSRANQNGPEAYGFRGNARNYDLNRDFIKADSKNARSFYEIYHQVEPDVFVDTHVSNGADYQYVITHLATQHNKLGGEMGEYLEATFIPTLEEKMKEKESEITPYVNVFNRTPDPDGFSQFYDGPRYSTGYTTLFHTLGFMIETHMLKPFDQRVKATYDFLEAVLEITKKDGAKIKALHKEKLKSLFPGDLHAISWTLDRTQSKEIEFKGYEGEQKRSEVTGQNRLFYNREKPFAKKLPYYNTFIADKEVTVPKAYVIPQGWHEVIARLKLNNIEMKAVGKDTSISVEVYHIKDFETRNSPYEGHYLHTDISVNSNKETVTFRKGDWYIPIGQKGARYLLETLEPHAPGSFFAWNFFDTILQQKEHFSPYVFEDIALKLLEKKPELKEAFETKKAQDDKFKESWYAQLNFIYEYSQYYEKAHLRYPIYRVAD